MTEMERAASIGASLECGFSVTAGTQIGNHSLEGSLASNLPLSLSKFTTTSTHWWGPQSKDAQEFSSHLREDTR